MSVAAHVAALLARVRSDPQIANVVFEGNVTGSPERYANVWHDTGFWTSHDAHGNEVDVEVTFTIHGVGNTRQQAVWVSDRVRALVLGWKPTIPGRNTWKVTSAGSQPVQKDTDVTPPKFFTADRYVMRSTPAPKEP